MTARRRLLTRFAVAVLLTAGISLGAAGSASAHNVLISSNPADGSTLRTVPSSVTFTFDQPVQNFDPVVSLIGPDGKQYATGTPQISGNAVTGNIGVGAAGAYTAAYRVVSADGHPVTGEIHFTLAAGAARASSGVLASNSSAVAPAAGSSTTATPTPVTTVSTVTATAAAGRGGLSPWIWIGLIVAALIFAAAAVILLRRPATDRSSDKDY